MAMPIEKMARNRLATGLSAVSTFFTSGGNWMKRMEPTAQNRLIAMIARNSRRICMVPRTSAMDDRMMWKSIGWADSSDGAGGTLRPAT